MPAARKLSADGLTARAPPSPVRRAVPGLRVCAMRLLVLGGTSFVGRAIVEDALARGFEVTLFGRGRTGTALFPDVERRVGDRDSGDYAALSGSWDAVADVSGYVPRHVREASA